MDLSLVAGSGNPRLGRSIAARLESAPAEVVLDRFPDGSAGSWSSRRFVDTTCTSCSPAARPSTTTASSC